ncbi:unnamed protein product [Brassica oleracea]
MIEISDFLTPIIASIDLGISSRLEFLANQSLIHISPYGIVVRHGLLEKIGREIVVLSKNYASSSRCLDELVEIMNCNREFQKVVTIFDNVVPSDVGRSQDLADLANIDGVNSRKWDNEAKMLDKTGCDVLEGDKSYNVR